MIFRVSVAYERIQERLEYVHDYPTPTKVKKLKKPYQVYFDATMAEIDEWCRMNCKGLFRRQRNSALFEFALKEDTALFTMIWGEIDIG
jgi:hypothetical protein